MNTPFKSIVMCFDGTNNNFGKRSPSNVLKLYRMLDRENPFEQICYYQRKYYLKYPPKQNIF